jgi:hypothetical protein
LEQCLFQTGAITARVLFRQRGVAKVCQKVSLQVTDSAYSLFAVSCVAFVITYATCQGLYFQLFSALEGRSARLCKNGARFAPEGNHHEA